MGCSWCQAASCPSPPSKSRACAQARLRCCGRGPPPSPQRSQPPQQQLSCIFHCRLSRPFPSQLPPSAAALFLQLGTGSCTQLSQDLSQATEAFPRASARAPEQTSSGEVIQSQSVNKPPQPWPQRRGSVAAPCQHHR